MFTVYCVAANVKLLIPPRANMTKKHALVVYNYAAPRAQQVTQEYSFNTHPQLHYFSVKMNAFVAIIDARGSNNDGLAKRVALYKKLGTVEVDDQIAVTDWIVNNMPQIDRNAVAMYGISYGAYVALLSLIRDKKLRPT